MIINNKFLLIISILLVLFCNRQVHAQCTTTINTFPYNEGFEANNGGWSVATNSSNPDWEWGTPNKPVIKNAASGVNCWIIGGLTASHYNNGENAFLLSPCFDFTAVLHPYISFKCFWETEKKYDGANFQYSTDGGSTWTLVGSYADYIACPSSNWFNTSNINTLGGAGWSGNIQTTSPCAGGAGNGSGDWLVSKSSMDYLAGKSSVQFRFAFAAGTQCNDYDGFAIDDIFIGEAPPNTADFTYTCGSNNSVSFALITGLCPSDAVWDFGDIASPNNTSTALNPTHIFSSGGTYTVSLTVNFTNNPSIIVPPKTITVLQVNTTITNTIKCNGDMTGAVTATASGTVGPYTYSWNTNPVQTTASISNLPANIYTITVSAVGACNGSTAVTISQPAIIAASMQIIKSKCGNNNGAVNPTISGGTAPYQSLWNNGQTSNSIKNIAAGTYALQVTDANNCVQQFNTIIVDDSTVQLNLFLGEDTLICPGNRLILRPGIYSSYQWQNSSVASTFTVTKTGTYWVKVIDSNGCKASDTIHVTVDCSDVFFPTAFTPNGDTHNETFGPLGNIAALKNYSFYIYDRWGELVFHSTNPLEKWNGKYNRRPYDTGSFVWLASYSLNGKVQTKKGTVILLR